MKDILKHTIQEDSKIKKVTSPLKTTFGITEFWHYTIRPDGTFTYLANNPDISDHYYGNQLYKLCPLFKHPSCVEPLIIPSNSLKDRGYQVGQGEVQEKFGQQMPFNIIVKQNGIYHGFGFSTRNPDFPLDSVCVNHFDRLKQFCEYFMQETALIERKVLNEQCNIGKELGPLFHQPLSPSHTSPNALKDFYRKLKGPQAQNRVNAVLSKREKECMALLLQGNCCREIGEKLDLSIRTVESYFVVIKEKLQCQTRSALFEVVQELECFGLFI